MTETTLLIVDDDPRNLDLILSILEDQKFRLLYAPNGEIALNLLGQEQVDLVIMDWEMPVLNGIEALTRMKGDEALKDIPIIISTGVKVNPKDLKEALDVGAVDYLRKPFHPLEFKARVEANLRMVRQHEQILELLTKEKERAEDHLERKRRELAASALREHQLSQFMSEFLDRLGEVRSKGDSISSSDLDALYRMFKSEFAVNNTYSNFMSHFEEVHPSFLQSVEQRHPAVSLNDRRLCAYLRIGLSNQEIANIANVESASIRRSLTRLKKKMELSAEEGLRAYLSRI